MKMLFFPFRVVGTHSPFRIKLCVLFFWLSFLSFSSKSKRKKRDGGFFGLSGRRGQSHETRDTKKKKEKEGHAAAPHRKARDSSIYTSITKRAEEKKKGRKKP